MGESMWNRWKWVCARKQGHPSCTPDKKSPCLQDGIVEVFKLPAGTRSGHEPEEHAECAHDAHSKDACDRNTAAAVKIRVAHGNTAAVRIRVAHGNTAAVRVRVATWHPLRFGSRHG